MFILGIRPLEAVDEASFRASFNGVEGIVDIKEFAEQWTFGFNYMFKLK